MIRIIVMNIFVPRLHSKKSVSEVLILNPKQKPEFLNRNLSSCETLNRFPLWSQQKLYHLLDHHQVVMVIIAHIVDVW